LPPGVSASVIWVKLVSSALESAPGNVQREQVELAVRVAGIGEPEVPDPSPICLAASLIPWAPPTPDRRDRPDAQLHQRRAVDRGGQQLLQLGIVVRHDELRRGRRSGDGDFVPPAGVGDAVADGGTAAATGRRGRRGRTTRRDQHGGRKDGNGGGEGPHRVHHANPAAP
jgi:hypothetical protein